MGRRVLFRRLTRLEVASSLGSVQGGLPPWRTPEQQAERAGRFAALFEELDALYGHAGEQQPKRPEEACRDPFEELFDLIEDYRKEIA